MLGRKKYKQEELDQCTGAIQKQLAAYNRPLKAIDGTAGKKVASARKDSNPLNEVELPSDSLMNNEGVLRANNVIKYDRDESVVKLQVGDPIKLTESDFERLSSAFFAQLECRFLERKARTTRQRPRAAAGAR